MSPKKRKSPRSLSDESLDHARQQRHHENDLGAHLGSNGVESADPGGRAGVILVIHVIRVIHVVHVTRVIAVIVHHPRRERRRRWRSRRADRIHDEIRGRSRKYPKVVVLQIQMRVHEDGQSVREGPEITVSVDL